MRFLDLPGWGLLLALVGWVVARQSSRRPLWVPLAAAPRSGVLFAAVG